MPNARNFFHQKELKIIAEKIAEVEKITSGEIRLHLHNKCAGDPIQDAWKAFEKLQMNATKQRNGVLIYLAVKDKKAAIVSDEGINKKLGEHYLNHLIDELMDNFRQGLFLKGILRTVENVGRELVKYFPIEKDDVDELPNDVSFEDD